MESYDAQDAFIRDHLDLTNVSIASHGQVSYKDTSVNDEPRIK